jgi:tight adherence protein C
MDALLTSLDAVPAEYMVSALVFTATAILAFVLMGMMRARGDLRRRTAAIVIDPSRRGADGARSLRRGSMKAAQRLFDYANRHFSPADGEMRVLQTRLIQAGFLGERAGAFFFLARVILAVAFGVATLVVAPTLIPRLQHSALLAAWLGAVAGYLAPRIYLDRRIARRRLEHRMGFPDFMDLLVVCADAGLSMEAALDRVGRELSDSYPSLSTNIYMTTLEIRAGRPLSEAFEHFAERLGLDEARSFATLLQQSQELGSSLTEALRVYSDDMRHKRMSLAEEKAYSLPAKLSVPLILCIFPVIIIVILLPVYVRVKLGIY